MNNTPVIKTKGLEFHGLTSRNCNIEEYDIDWLKMVIEEHHNYLDDHPDEYFIYTQTAHWLVLTHQTTEPDNSHTITTKIASIISEDTKFIKPTQKQLKQHSRNIELD